MHRASVAQCEVSAYAPNPFLNPFTIKGDICNFVTAVSALSNTSQRSVYNYSHKIKNISPLIVNGFKNGFHKWIQHIFLVVVEAKNFFCEIFFVFKIWMHFTALCG